ncbi:MAG: ParB/RepB/Spo0J family partition protein [Gemmataceae bacterium]
MDTTKTRMGKGLDALLGSLEPLANAPGAGSPQKLPCERIQMSAYQPRLEFDTEELQKLRDSIQVHGVLQPLLVRATDANGYQLVAGHRRLRAAQDAGLREVPVHVLNLNDQQAYEAALIENIQRADLNPIEKATGFKDYLERYSMKQDELAKRLGLDRTTISNLLGLLHLPGDVQDAVRLGQISMAHAKVLKGLSTLQKQSEMCKQVILTGMSAHALEQLVKQARNEPPAPKPKPKPEPVAKSKHVVSIENQLHERLACKVQIKLQSEEKGQIVLDFQNNEDFERIIQALSK